MFIAAVFTRGKRQKQLKYPHSEYTTNVMLYVYYYSTLTISEPGVVAHTYRPSMWEADARDCHAFDVIRATEQDHGTINKHTKI